MTKYTAEQTLAQLAFFTAGLIDASDCDPDDTFITVRAVAKDKTKRDLIKLSLTEVLERASEIICEANTASV